MITGKNEIVEDIFINGKYVRCCRHCIDFGETDMFEEGCGNCSGNNIGYSCITCLENKKEVYIGWGNKCFEPESQTD